jgi:hypothetical protein
VADASNADAPLDAVACMNVPNDPDAPMASGIGISGSTTMATFPGLLLCPAGDRDCFSVTLTTPNSDLEMLIDSTTSSPDVVGSILNQSGDPIANAAPVTSMPNRQRAASANMPTGMYYACVSAGPTVLASYQLTLTVTRP